MFRYSLAFCLVIFCTVLFPSVAFATTTFSTLETLPAGFATAPLWISSASPVDGDALKLFAVVNNSATTTISGAVSFLVDGTTVGSAKVSLGAGTAQIISTAWTAVAGTHTITATFDQPIGVNGQSVSLSGIIAGPLSITVAEAPPKPVVLQYLDTAIDVASPAISGVLATIDSARQSGADYFATQLGLGTTSPAPQGQVLGAATENLANAGAAVVTAATSSSSLFNRLAYIFFNNPLIFYPILILSIILALWLISRIFSRN